MSQEKGSGPAVRPTITDSGAREALERSAGLIDILERNLPNVDPATWVEARSDIAKIRAALRAAAPVERPSAAEGETERALLADVLDEVASGIEVRVGRKNDTGLSARTAVGIRRAAELLRIPAPTRAAEPDSSSVHEVVAMKIEKGTGWMKLHFTEPMTGEQKLFDAWAREAGDLMDRLRAACRDERLSTGALYLEAANFIERAVMLVGDGEAEIVSLKRRRTAVPVERPLDGESVRTGYPR